MSEVNVWGIKGATFSDKSAIEDYGLTIEEIRDAVKSEKLQYRINYVYDNPYFKLVRKEVEKLVEESYGKPYLETMKLKTQLRQVEKELKRLKRETKIFENRKTELQLKLDGSVTKLIGTE